VIHQGAACDTANIYFSLTIQRTNILVKLVVEAWFCSFRKLIYPMMALPHRYILQRSLALIAVVKMDVR